jgi:DNA-binding NtrC family response regulator
MAAILVIDPSPTVRETLRIVLGREHAVSLAPSWDDVASRAPPDLVIFGAPPPPRDDAAIGATRARVAADAPLLLLNAAREVDVRALAPVGHRVAFLPAPFDAAALRAQVRALLTPIPSRAPTPATVTRHRRWIEPPLLTPAAAALARRATLTDVPVLLVGERGTGATDVAQAIHFFAGAAGRVVVRSARAIATRLLADDDERAAVVALVIEDVHLLSPAAQHALLAHLRNPDEDVAALRVFATTDVDLDAYAAKGLFTPELAYALGSLPIVLAPLRERASEMPALVEALVPSLSARLRLEAVTFTTAALARLSQYLWFGNVAELEAVLARTLAVHRPRVVEPEMLLFTAADASRALATPPATPRTGTEDDASPMPAPDGRLPEPADSAASPIAEVEARAPSPTSTRTQRAPSTPSMPTAGTPAASVPAPSAASRGRVLPLERRRSDDPTAGAANERPASDATADRRPPSPTTSRPGAVDSPATGATGAGPSLEVLLGELAHELRNPMVTIKTFAQHLDDVLDDAEVRARFATLAGEAITRMDTLLETLLDFSRFRAPLRQRVDLAALLARALDERASELARKGARIEHVASAAEPSLVEADEAQMLFALRSLVGGLVRDLVPHTAVRIATGAGGALELTVHADRAIATRLAAYVETVPDYEAAAVPLAFALATALIRRNAGRLEIRAADDGATIIMVTIPRADVVAER